MTGWDSNILDLASNTYWVIGIFIFFTLLLHLLFVFLWPLSLKTWKVADYLWLMLAFLSTLGLVGEAKQYRAESNHFESQWATTQSLNEVRGWFTNYQVYICDEVKILKEKKLDNTDYHNLCDWLEGRINDLNLIQKASDKEFPVLSSSLSDGLGQFSTIIPRIEQKILDARIEKYTQKHLAHTENISAEQRSPLQMFIIILAPMMLAFALAIRVTKVTAEYRLL